MNKHTIRALIALVLAAAVLTGCPKNETETEGETTTESAETTEANDTTAEAETSESETTADEVEEGGTLVTSEKYGVQFRVPENWEIAKGEDGSVSATDSDGTTTIVLVGTDSQATFEKAVEQIKQEVELKEVKLGAAEPAVVNGLAGFKGDGTGVLAREEMDQEIQFIAYSLRVGGEAISMMIFSEAEMYEAKKELILGIADTLQKTK